MRHLRETRSFTTTWTKAARQLDFRKQSTKNGMVDCILTDRPRMTPEGFVDELARLLPTASQLAAIGLSPAEVERFCETFIARARPAPAGDDRSAVRRLLQRWDMSRIEIGMVRFADNVQELEGRARVGDVEADPLLIISKTGELVVEDLAAPGHMLWAVAVDETHFLDALIHAAAFLAKRLLGEIGLEDTLSARDAAEKCAVLAGGDRYRQFYVMLLGGD